MKLVTCEHAGQQVPGVVVQDKIVLIAAACAALPEFKEQCETLPTTLRGIIADADACVLIQKLATYVEQGGELPEKTWVAYDAATIGIPIPDPSKIICLAGNYRKHCEEGKAPVPPNPMLFSKFSNTLTATKTDVIKPIATNMLDYEAELAIVIGKQARNVAPEQAYEYVFGYTCLNDISARDLQLADKQWVRAKGFDTFAPLGPVVVTHDEIGDPHNLRIQMLLNGEIRQDSNTANMENRIPQIVSFISQVFTLEPGDIISTGTPAGVGFYSQPQRLLRAGDQMQVKIEKIGTLENTVVDAAVPEPRQAWHHQPPEIDQDKIFG